MKKDQSSLPFMQRLLVVCFACITLSIAGCSFFGGDNADDERVVSDVCDDIFNSFVTQHPDGLGITSDECVDSPRGQWIEGRCYCHGVDE